MNPRRRAIVASALSLPAAAWAQQLDSPAPKAASPGRWITRAPLPLPRSEMAWAAHEAFSLA